MKEVNSVVYCALMALLAFPIFVVHKILSRNSSPVRGERKEAIQDDAAGGTLSADIVREHGLAQDVKTWARSSTYAEHHIWPINDLKEHVLVRNCWCRPTFSADGWIYAHHSLDGREFSEPDLNPKFQQVEN